MNQRQKRATHPTMQPGNSHISNILARVFLGLSLLIPMSSELHADNVKRLDVLELFTSQGCSSCPPADALIGQLSKTKDMLVLTMPVNYWDHLGWRDTLAKESFTKRQYAYATLRGDRQIYTPQVVVNGVTHVVGSQRDHIEAARKATSRSLASVSVPVSIVERDGHLYAETGPAPSGSKYRAGKIWVVCYSNSVSVEIGRGENRGRDVTYTNVVRNLDLVGRWSGEATHFPIDISKENKFDGLAIILQADDSGAILGAATIPSTAQ